MRKATIPKACPKCAGRNVLFETVVVGEGTVGAHETVIALNCVVCGKHAVMPCCGYWDFKPHSANCPIQRQLDMVDLDF